MFDKKCLNTEIKTHVKTVEEEDEEICKINKNLKHDQAPFIYRDDGETTWNRPGYDIHEKQEKQDIEPEMFYLNGKLISGEPNDYNTEFINIVFYAGIVFMLFNWINKLIYVEEPKCVI